MLILTRSINETLLIGDEIKVTVLALEDSGVKLGISSPSHVEISREEEFDSLKTNNKAAPGND